MSYYLLSEKGVDPMIVESQNVKAPSIFVDGF